MPQDVLCIGGGITGQLLKTVIPKIRVLDWRNEDATSVRKLTRQFGANYLWEPLDHIPCKPLRVVTHIDGQPPTLEKIRAYKDKVGKTADMGTWSQQFLPEVQGWELEKPLSVPIEFGRHVIGIEPKSRILRLKDGQTLMYSALISTVPLYALLGMLHINIDERFRFAPIYVKVGPRPPDAPCPTDTLYVNYLSSRGVAPYRFTDRGEERHYESLNTMGGIPTRKIVPGKIYPHTRTEELIREFEFQYNIFSFGRFATWNPEELVHQTYHQILDRRDQILSWL